MPASVEEKIESLTERIETLKKRRFNDPENASTATQVLDAAIASLEEFLEIVENDDLVTEVLETAREIVVD